MKREYNKPITKIVVFAGNILQEIVIPQGSDTDDFPTKKSLDVEEENENFSNSVWSTY
jgi:hypothetical protein